MSASKARQFTSGSRLLSGRRTSGLRSGLRRSGFPLTSGFGGCDEFMVGEDIEVEAPIAFQLAPRLYELARADSNEQCAKTGAAAIADLPVHLLFRESAPTVPLRQCWVSDGTSCWNWELVVEQCGNSAAVTLTATPPGAASAKPLTWRASDAWQPFGSNTLDPDPAGAGSAPLIVRVP